LAAWVGRAQAAQHVSEHEVTPTTRQFSSEGHGSTPVEFLLQASAACGLAVSALLIAVAVDHVVLERARGAQRRRAHCCGFLWLRRLGVR
jgi:hypothetical protein